MPHFAVTPHHFEELAERRKDMDIGDFIYVLRRLPFFALAGTEMHLFDEDAVIPIPLGMIKAREAALAHRDDGEYLFVIEFPILMRNMKNQMKFPFCAVLA
jgi:hypothetical protein